MNKILVRSFFLTFFNLLLITSFVSESYALVEKNDIKNLKKIIIQDGSELKPLTVFLKEALFFIEGEIHVSSIEAVQKCVSWILEPKKYENKKIISIQNDSLKKILQSSAKEKLFSPLELAHNEMYQHYYKEVLKRQDEGVVLNKSEKAVLNLYEQLRLFYGIAQNTSMSIVPFTQKNKNEWLSITDLLPGHTLDPELPENIRYEFLMIFGELLQSFRRGEGEAVSRFSNLLIQLQKDVALLSNTELPYVKSRWNANYHQIRFLRIFWIFNLFLIAVFSAYLLTKNKGCLTLGRVGFSLLFILTLSLFAWRWYLRGVLPVTNGYELMLWVPGSIALIIILTRKAFNRTLYVLSASIIGFILFFLIDMEFVKLNPYIEAFNLHHFHSYWFFSYLMSLLAGFSILSLCFVLSHIALVYFWASNKNQYFVKTILLFLKTYIQLGFFLLLMSVFFGACYQSKVMGVFWLWTPREMLGVSVLLTLQMLITSRKWGWVRDEDFLVFNSISFLMVALYWAYTHQFLTEIVSFYHFEGYHSGTLWIIVTMEIILSLFYLYERLHIKTRAGKLINESRMFVTRLKG